MRFPPADQGMPPTTPEIGPIDRAREGLDKDDRAAPQPSAWPHGAGLAEGERLAHEAVLVR